MDFQPSQKKQESYLLAVPLEVLLDISSYLSTTEYGNLRRVCQDIEASLFKTFAEEYFSKKPFMFTETSLRDLVNISNSRFAPSLRYLIMTLHHPPPPPSSNHTKNAIDALEHNRKSEEYNSHRTFIGLGQHVELLTEALCNLPNLEMVGLQDFRPPHSYRDASGNGSFSLWDNYDTPRFNGEKRFFLDEPIFDKGGNFDIGGPVLYTCDAFLTILRALGKTRETHNSARLEVRLQRCNLPAIALNVPRHLEPSILPFLQNLKVLSLDLGPQSLQSTYHNNNGRPYVYFGSLISKFLSRTPSLEHLSLTFRNCEYLESKGILEWLAEVPFTLQHWLLTRRNAGLMGDIQLLPQLPPPPPEYLCLEQLDIAMVSIKPPLLLNLFARYKSSLRRILLHDVIFRCPTPYDSTVKVNLWARFMSQLAELGLNLSTIRLSHVWQEYKGCLCTVWFKNAPNAPFGFTRAWTGNDLRRGSMDFITSMAISWPEHHETDTGDESSDND
ncbi:hypothetical protein F4677DRAFT_43212 [Hypoxylon crocopeplum]|nr:hypothetical protein F4677DRAFT_43212 [Hypoxylon crocopeplum]